MKRMIYNRLRLYGFLFAVILLAPAVAFAGIPAPGIVLYGQVFDNSNALVTAGTLKWKFTLPAPAAPIDMSVDLKPVRGSAGVFSYTLILPLETSLPDYPVDPGAVPAEDTAVAVGVSAELVGKTVSRTDSFSVSRADIGTYRRFSFGDLDADALPDRWEQTIINANPADSLTGIADVNPSADFDKDGLPNLYEYELGTNPAVFDQVTPGDVDGDNAVSLTDAVICLKILSRLHVPGVTLKIFNDVNGDRRIGIHEAVFILRMIAGAVN